MRREIPGPAVVAVIVVVVAAIGAALYLWFSKPTTGTGISDADLRAQVRYRQQHGMLPGAPPPAQPGSPR